MSAPRRDSDRKQPSQSRRTSQESIRSNATKRTSLTSNESQRSQTSNKERPGSNEAKKPTQNERSSITSQDTALKPQPSEVRFKVDRSGRALPDTESEKKPETRLSIDGGGSQSDSFQSLDGEEEEVIEPEIVHHRDSNIPYNSPRLTISRVQRLQFLLKSSFMAFFVMLLTHFEVGIIRMIDPHNFYKSKVFYISHIFGLFALILFALILWKARFRYSQIVFAVLYEFIIIYLIFIVDTNVKENIITIISTSMIFWATATIADYCPLDLTKPFIVVLIAYGAFIAKFIVLSNLHLIPGVNSSTAISLSCIGMTFTLLFTVVNIELVVGGREYEIHFRDKHMGPLIIYFDIINLYVDHLILYRGILDYLQQKK